MNKTRSSIKERLKELNLVLYEALPLSVMQGPSRSTLKAIAFSLKKPPPEDTNITIHIGILTITTTEQLIKP
jgi:hypothetical protein